MIKVVLSLHLEWKEAGTMQPAVRDMVNHSPICFDPSRVFYLDLVATDPDQEWNACFFSVENESGRHDIHVDACMQVPGLRNFSMPAWPTSGWKYCRAGRCRAFGMFFDYSDIYRGVRYVVGCGNECAGVVQLDMKHRRSDTWLDVPLSDSFAQIGDGRACCRRYVACVCTPCATGREVLHYGHVHLQFVFNPTTGELVEVMLGVQWGRVAKASMNWMLQMRTKDESVLRLKPVPNVHSHQLKPAPRNAHINTAPTVNSSTQKPSPKSKAQSASSSARRDMTNEVRGLVARLTGIEASELELDAEITDYGSDSLMGMELGREVERMFKCKLDQAQQMEATRLRKFVPCVENTLFGQDSSEATDERHPPTEPER
ncbi:hypothetical protein ETB97_002565 [Aspergillus alliaceus]|uniref:Carrier domain-containing protein n=1 Tax=Petromyces alliaceus TaxID=209559 RepID=A0A8H6A3V7_PETAA|nr:hypothetical protein ETB97_002565 [Aspergillus burnettii]